VLKKFDSETLTHLIWSYGDEKRLKTAQIYSITVVTPLWVERCKQVWISDVPKSVLQIYHDRITE
jgi:hypothetical protein